MSQLPEHDECVHEGWRPILAVLHETIVAGDPDYDVAQVKEKFGGLRVYLNTPETPYIRGAISAAEEVASQTCEFCGQPGKTRAPKGRPGGWIHTVCDEHWS